MYYNNRYLNSLQTIILLLLLLFFVNLNNGQLTPPSDDKNLKLYLYNTPTFPSYPSSSSDSYCQFQINGIAFDQGLNADPPSIASNSVNATLFQTSSMNNKTNFYINLKVGFGSLVFNLTITSKGGLNKVDYQYNYTCIQIDTSKINAYFILEYPGIFMGEIVSRFKIDGMEYDTFNINSIAISSKNGFISPDLEYYFVWGKDYIKNNLYNSNWTVAFDFAGKNVTFSTKSYFSQFPETSSVPTDITFYPENLLDNQVYTEFGYNNEPIFKYKINSSILNSPYQFLWLENIYAKPTNFLKGSKGDMTMVCSFAFSSFVFDGNPRTYNFTFQNGSTLSNLPYITNIEKYNIPLTSITLIVNQMDSILLPMFDASFNNSNGYYFTRFKHIIKRELEFSMVNIFPFGFTFGSNSNYDFSVCFSKPRNSSRNLLYSINTEQVSTDENKSYSIIIGNTNVSPPPSMQSYEYFKLGRSVYILRLHIVSTVGLSNIKLDEINIGLNYLVEGDLYNGKYEIALKLGAPFSKIILEDIFTGISEITYGSFINIDELKQYLQPVYSLKKYSYSSFYNISFGINNIDLLNNVGYNIMYLDSTDIDPDDVILLFALTDPISFNLENMVYYPIEYNSTLKLFTCKFIIPKNNIYDEISYLIYVNGVGFIISSLLPDSCKLRVNQTYLDAEGPIISNINKIGEGSFISGMNNSVGWQLTIVDDFNGFGHGYIKIMGSEDGSAYRFNFTTNDLAYGDRWNGTYNIIVSVDQPCVSQQLVIVYVELYDTNNVISIFDLYSNDPNSLSNPFINFYQAGINITKISYTCNSTIEDRNIGTLLKFLVSKTTIDVGSNDRLIQFDFAIQSTSTGIKKDQNPIVYITSNKLQQVECPSLFVSNESLRFNYTCQTILPVGFGYPGEILFSIYGFINNGGAFYGFSTQDLLISEVNYYADTILSVDKPVISSTSKFYSYGGNLIIYGRGFYNISKVSFSFKPNGPYFLDIVPTNTSYFASAILISDIIPVSSPFLVRVENNAGIAGFQVYPIFFNMSQIDPPYQTPTPTSTPTPSNAPKCQSDSECGGVKQGYCSNTGCICIAPWMGPTCTSQIIIVPPPAINTTNPSTEIPIKPSPNENSDSTDSNETSEILFRSLISLISIREVDFNGVQVDNHIFDRWIYTPVSEFKNQYFTTIQSKSNKDITTNITAILEWFNSSTTIEFAKQNLTMNPSSIKYTIECTEYGFANKLNSLQLIMSAEFQSSKANDVCSTEEFSESSDDISDYLKIQIDDHSLYGRFIKRALIDGQSKTINNLLLDKSMNAVKSTASSVQSLIGIVIPYFEKSITIDPDFSVIIDSNPASSSSRNSICNTSKSTLTKPQLAGIIIGCVGFATVITIAVVYHFVKKNSQKKFIKNMNNKMNQLN